MILLLLKKACIGLAQDLKLAKGSIIVFSVTDLHIFFFKHNSGLAQNQFTQETHVNVQENYQQIGQDIK